MNLDIAWTEWQTAMAAKMALYRVVALEEEPVSDQTSFILRILNAVETHDYRTLLDYTLGEAINYFGHKNSTNAYVQQDMTQDARSYRWCRFDPDLGTFQTSLGHDSIEYNSDAMDVRGKEHKARCRLDIYYTPTPSPRLQALSLKVLASHAPTGNSRPTFIGPAAGQDEQSGYENAIAQGTKIIKTKVIPQYETKDGFSVKPLDIKYENDPTIAEQIRNMGRSGNNWTRWSRTHTPRFNAR